MFKYLIARSSKYIFIILTATIFSLITFSKKAANLNPGGATGFGVRLLNHLVKEYYE